MTSSRMALSCLLLLCLAMSGSPAGATQTPVAELDPSSFSATVDNEYLAFSSLASKTYAGQETDPETDDTVELRLEETVLPDSKTIDGRPALVIEARDFEDGELTELTHDYYAQYEDGTVYYMGEDVDNYDNGQVANHDGSWISGENGAQAGVFLSPSPSVLDSFAQEQVPGIAEDLTIVIETGLSVSTTGGDFDDCMKTVDYDPLGKTSEFKWYCAGVGLVREQYQNGFIELTDFAKAA